jgi:hypothetical protein
MSVGPILRTKLYLFFAREDARMTLVTGPPEEREGVLPNMAVPVYTAVVPTRLQPYEKGKHAEIFQVLMDEEMENTPDKSMEWVHWYHYWRMGGDDYIIARTIDAVTCAVKIHVGDYEGSHGDKRTSVKYSRRAIGESCDCGMCGGVAVVGLRRHELITRGEDVLFDEKKWLRPY